MHLKRKIRSNCFLSIIVFVLLVGLKILNQGPVKEIYVYRYLVVPEFTLGGYVLNTSSCKIPNMNPFDKAVALVHKTPKFQTCQKPLVLTLNQTIVLNRQEFTQYKNVTCCYMEFHRNTLTNYTKWTADWTNEYSQCYPIEESKNGKRIEPEFVKIQCNYTTTDGEDKTWINVGSNVLPPKLHSKSTKFKYNYWKKERQKTSSNTHPSVLVIGIDSVSRLHMLRSLPKTKKFLKKNDFVDMKGYTKIGENTFPNLMGALGGMRYDDYSCLKAMKLEAMDACPLIWKNFSAQNYITGFIEDAPTYGTFNYLKTGFVEQPTDYYFRPLSVAYQGEQDKDSVYTGCVGGMNQTAFMMRYLKDVIKVMSREVPYFIWAWFTTLAHDDFNDLRLSDYPLRRDLEYLLKREGSNSVIIVMSDHGYRFGKIRESVLGYYEDSLPFVFIRLPPFLKQKKPLWYRNLQTNTNRLTTPLDFHATLKDILSLSSKPNHPDKKYNPLDNSTHRAYSFFEEVPLNRTCENSFIPEQFCRCGSLSEEEQVNTKFFQDNIVHSLMDATNGEVREQIDQGICEPLVFEEFLYIRKFEESAVQNGTETFMDYLIAFQASPAGKFEVKCRVFKNGSFKFLGYVARINSNINNGACVSTARLKWYCYCKSAVEPLVVS